MELTHEQKNIIKKYIKGYNNWSEKDKNLKDHLDHHEFFKSKFKKDNIGALNESDFAKIYKKLWASNIWGNKEWYIENKLLEPNGLSKIKDELKILLYGEENIDVRFDNFRKNIKGFGPSSISEILHFVFPSKFCLWNDKPKTVLPFLGLNILPEKFFKYSLQTGAEYQQCINALKAIKDELANNGFENPDYIDLDCFFWYIFNTIDFSKKPAAKEPTIRRKNAQIKSHEDAEEIILKLGKMLNYLPYLTLS